MYENATIPGRLGGATEAAAPETEVLSELRQLCGMVEQVNISAQNLCDRLHTVQRPTAPQPTSTSGGAVPQAVLCPLADQLRNLREALSSTAMLLESNKARLEI